jgi:NAD(P)-dependent dehydrogenase (short-subunit alcohol dehydrogenase family)
VCGKHGEKTAAISVVKNRTLFSTLFIAELAHDLGILPYSQSPPEACPLRSLWHPPGQIPHGRLRESCGKIVNIASLLSFQRGIRVPAYAASKGGVAAAYKALANEWAPKGIQVNAIASGYFATSNTEGAAGG